MTARKTTPPAVTWWFLAVAAAALLLTCAENARAQTLTITTSSLPNGAVGVFYSQQLSATGGTLPYDWDITAGVFPPGLALSSSGGISGTPTSAGVFNFTVRVRDHNFLTASKQLSITINPSVVIITTPSCPSGRINTPYLCELTASGGTPPYTWSISAGGLPGGLTLDSSIGVISGTPAALGTSSFTVRVSDRAQAAATKSLVISVFPPDLTIQTASCPNGTVGATYSCALSAAGGMPPYDWTIARGSLPPGLALNASTGGITGTPTTAGDFSFSVRVTDNAGATAIKQFAVTIAPERRPTFFPLSPAELTFAASSGGPPPPGQNIQLSSSVAGVAFSVTVSTTGGGRWLAATPVAGSMPALVRVTADPAQLPPGPYSGTVTVAAPGADPSVRTVTVTFAVGPQAPARLDVAPSSLVFSFGPQANATTKTLFVSNGGSGSLSYTADVETTTGGQWLAVTSASGTVTASAPALLTVRANPTGIGPGTYSGRISISSVTTREKLVVPVTMTISSSRQILQLSPTGLTFRGLEGSRTVPPQSFRVLNIGQGAMSWSVSTSTLSAGPNWLSVTPPSGSTDPASPAPRVEVRVNPSGLARGEYYGQVEVSGPGADNSPQFLSVVLNVVGAAAVPALVVEPTGLIFTGVAGGTSPAPQSLLLSNLDTTPKTFTSSRFTSDGSNWFVTEPAAGTVAPDQPTSITVRPNLTGLTPGVRRGTLTIAGSDGSPLTVSLLLVLVPGPRAARQFSPIAQAGCTPAQLFPVFTKLLNGFDSRVAWPNPIEVQVFDDCGSPLTAGSVAVSFSNGDPPLFLVPLGEGRWSATWTPGNARSQVNVIASAAGEGGIKGTWELLGSLEENPNAPVVSEDGVVGAASYAPTALAPGAIISIFGRRLADRAAEAPSLPLGAELAGTTVFILSSQRVLPLPLLYASGGQINAIVPYELATDIPLQLFVRRGSTQTVVFKVTVATAQPAVFTWDNSGAGAITNALWEPVQPSRPASRGQPISIYCTGLGPVTPRVSAGIAAPSAPLSWSTYFDSITVTIGGVPAQVLFAGLAPGFVGLYQVNVIIPERVSPGNEVPVVLTVAGQPSPVVTVAVR